MAQAAVRSEDIICPGGMPAFLARPDRGGTFPVVVLMHERYGLVRHTRELAERWARDGYACIAPDFFHKHPDQEALHRGAHLLDGEAGARLSARSPSIVGVELDPVGAVPDLLARGAHHVVHVIEAIVGIFKVPV